MVFYGQTIDGIPDRGHSLFVTALVMLLIAALFVAIRLATRYYMKKFGWDDFFLVIALVASTMTTVAINLAVVNGYGRHKAEMGENAQLAFKWFFVAQIPYKIALGCTKASILLLYIRIFITKNFQLLAKVCLGVVGAWTVASVLVTAFQCTPVEASWNKTIKDKRCIHKNAWWYSFASISTFTDIVIAILPINPVRQLKLSKRNRIGLYFVFAVGGFVCVTSIIRMVAVTKTSTALDQSWDFIPRSTWTLVECNMGIICACLPLMRRPLNYVCPWLFRGSTRGESEKFSYPTIELRSTKRQMHLHESQSQEDILRSPVRGEAVSVEDRDPYNISITTEIHQNDASSGNESLKGPDGPVGKPEAHLGVGWVERKPEY